MHNIRINKILAFIIQQFFCALVVILLLGTEVFGATHAAFTPGAPAGSYPLSNLDTINMYNGNLNVNFNFTEVIGRGKAKYPISMPINNSKWSVLRGDAS